MKCLYAHNAFRRWGSPCRQVDRLSKEEIAFKKSFKTFVVDRLEDRSDLSHQTPEYLKAHKLVIEASGKFMGTLTDEQKNLLIEYESVETAVSILEEEQAYIKGLRDGMNLNQMLSRLEGQN